MPQFDPADGDLTSTEIKLEIVFEGNIQFTNTAPDTADVALSLVVRGKVFAGPCSLSGELLNAEFTTEPVEILSVPAGDTVDALVEDDATDTVTLVDPNLAPYIGTGDATFAACFSGTPSFTSTGGLSGAATFSGNAFAKVTVTYTFNEPSIDVEKSTNGDDADAAPGPFIPEGGAVNWAYVVTNNGDLDLENIVLTDNVLGVVTCSATTLATTISMTCTAAGVAALGPYENVATVTDDAVGSASQAADTDSSHHFGFKGAIEIEKATNGEDDDLPPGQSIPVGDPVEWVYSVTNMGNVSLTGIVVVDDQGVAVTCPKTELAPATGVLPGESMNCTAAGVAVEGGYVNIGTATGQPVDDNGVALPGGTVSDSDKSHHVGLLCIKKGEKRPKPWPAGTELVTIDGVTHLVGWRTNRIVKIDNVTHQVTKESGRLFVTVDGTEYDVTTVPRIPVALPFCPKDDKKSKSKKTKHKKDEKQGAGGYKSKAGAITDPILKSKSCPGSKAYWLKGDGKHDAAWTQMGTNGKKTRFFANRMGYNKVLRKRSNQPYFKLARAYITAMLNEYSGTSMTPAMELSVNWAERYFSSHRARHTNLRAQSRNGSPRNVWKIKKLRKKMLRHAAALSDHGGAPNCSS